MIDKSDPLDPREAGLMARVRRWINGRSGVGETSARPLAPPFVGYPYFDTTLGIPIWWNGTGWVDATGTAA